MKYKYLYRWECFKCQRLCKCKSCKSESLNTSELSRNIEYNTNINNVNLEQRYLNNNQINQYFLSENDCNKIHTNNKKVYSIHNYVEINNKYLIYEIDSDENNHNKYSFHTNNSPEYKNNFANNLILNRNKCELYYYLKPKSKPNCLLCKFSFSNSNDLLYFISYDSFLLYLQYIFTVSQYEEILTVNKHFFIENKQNFLSYFSTYITLPHSILHSDKTICKLCLLSYVNTSNGIEKLIHNLYNTNIILNTNEPATSQFHSDTFNIYNNNDNLNLYKYHLNQSPFYTIDNYYNEILFYNFLNNLMYTNYFSSEQLIMDLPKSLNYFTKIHFMQINSALSSGITELSVWLFEIIQESKEKFYSPRLEDLAKQFSIAKDSFIKKCETFKIIFNEYNIKIHQLEESLNKLESYMKVNHDYNMNIITSMKNELIKEKQIFQENLNEFDEFYHSVQIMCFYVEMYFNQHRNIIESIQMYNEGRQNVNHINMNVNGNNNE